MIAVKGYCTFLLGHDAVTCVVENHITSNCCWLTAGIRLIVMLTSVSICVLFAAGSHYVMHQCTGHKLLWYTTYTSELVHPNADQVWAEHIIYNKSDV